MLGQNRGEVWILAMVSSSLKSLKKISRNQKIQLGKSDMFFLDLKYLAQSGETYPEEIDNFLYYGGN